MTSLADPYQVLMVPRGATATEIRGAFRTMIGQWHPDVCASPESLQRSAAIIQAYRTLSQAERRSGPDRRVRQASRPPVAAERRLGERRACNPGRLPRPWRWASLAWAMIASLTVVSTLAAELPAGKTDEITFSASPL